MVIDCLPDELLRTTLDQYGCVGYKMPLKRADPTIPVRTEYEDPLSIRCLHFKTPEGNWAVIEGALRDPELLQKNAKLTYYLYGHPELADYVLLGTQFDTIQEAVPAILEDLGTMNRLISTSLKESTTGIELYTDDGALKAKALGTKVVSSKTTNKLSDLETMDDVKELTPTQKKSVKGVVSALSSKGKLGDINKKFNANPDVVFKGNGDAVIYPDDGKPSYRITAKDIEKFEARKKVQPMLQEEVIKEVLPNDKYERDDFFRKERKAYWGFSEYRLCIETTNREKAKLQEKFTEFVDELHFLLDPELSTVKTNDKKYEIVITDVVGENPIVEIYFGMTRTGKWGIYVQYIGLEQPEIYACWNVYQEDIQDVKDVAADIAFVMNNDE